MLAGNGSIPRTNLLEKHGAKTRGRVGSSKTLPENIKLARLSILILSKAYPSHGILSHVTRLMKAYNDSGFSFS
jgi:hypothetical protein